MYTPLCVHVSVCTRVVSVCVRVEFFTNYTAFIWAWTSRGRGPPGNASFSTEQGPPGAPPSNVTVQMVGSRMATISWDLPPRESRHGIITGYRVALSVSGSEETLMNHSTTQLVLRNLTPYTNYTVRVAAVTVERGNFSQLESFRTATESEFYG